jgi:hypothetical protein
MMNRLLWVLLSLSLLAGCGKKEQYASHVPEAAAGKDAATESAKRYLAYEHSLQIETDSNKITAIYEKALAACNAVAGGSCTVLESQINSGDDAYASLKFRAKPDSIKKIIAALSQEAEIVRQSTTAEDLEAPISDAAKKLAMLKDYRAKLEALSGRASKDIDALIKVSSELARVQSDIEELEGRRARLMQRVETEILKVSIQSPHKRSFWRPIGSSFSEFGGNLSQGISYAITTMAYLLPWIAILIFMLWGGRKLWRRWKRS